MGHTVLSFLGAVRRGARPGQVAENYATVRYRFADGFQHSSIYSGAAVLARLRDQGRRLDRIVIFGTTGSQWDHLALSLGEPDDAATADAALALADRLHASAAADAVNEGDLAELQTLLRPRLGAPVALRLMSRCETEEEAQALIPRLVYELRHDRTLHVDITNGFRHLPVLALFATLLLERIDAVRVGAVYYGMADVAQGTGTVLDLRSLLDFAALAGDAKAFAASGDPSALAKALRAEGHDALAEALRLAAFHERTLQAARAAEHARRALSLVETIDTPRAGLFVRSIRDRLDWARSDPPLRDIRLAQQHLDNGDLALAALLGVEAAVTLFMLLEAPAGLTAAELDDRDRRDAMRNTAQEWIRGNWPPEDRNEVRRAFTRLRLIRNALAHAVPANQIGPWVADALTDPSILRREIQNSFDALFRHQRDAAAAGPGVEGSPTAEDEGGRAA